MLALVSWPHVVALLEGTELLHETFSCIWWHHDVQSNKHLLNFKAYKISVRSRDNCNLWSCVAFLCSKLKHCEVLAKSSCLFVGDYHESMTTTLVIDKQDIVLLVIKLKTFVVFKEDLFLFRRYDLFLQMNLFICLHFNMPQTNSNLKVTFS